MAVWLQTNMVALLALFVIDVSIPQSWADDAHGLSQAGFYLTGLSQ